MEGVQENAIPISHCHLLVEKQGFHERIKKVARKMQYFQSHKPKT
jgi:hypothetical protein